jgi:transposase
MLQKHGARHHLAGIADQIVMSTPRKSKISTSSKRSAPSLPVLVGEIFHRDFNNRRHLASYVGYAPSPFQSGNVAHDQGISKAGNGKGRTTGIELAWLWLRYQPDSELSAWFRARVGTTKGRIRRIAIVALARKLLVAALS